VGLSGKKHFGPPEVFPFEEVADVIEFVNRDPDRPYCLVVATKEPHAPWPDHDSGLYDPASLEVAPNLLDTPLTRRALARYYTSLTRLDRRIGECLDVVERSGRADGTIVVYTSDHGAQFPGGKWTCWEPGLRVPFVVRWPDRIEPGASSNALVQHVDVLPTCIEAAGGDPGDGGRFDGRSFLTALIGESQEHRGHVFGIATQHGTINGVPYPVRSVSDGRYKLILNLLHETEYSNALTGPASPRHENAYWGEWLEAAETHERWAFLVNRYLHRPARELYDLYNDPWELNNLVDDPQHGDVILRLERTLNDWMAGQGDEGVATEMKAPERQEK
jgi:uncharacterized sulfatase